MEKPKLLLPFTPGQTFLQRLTEVYLSVGCSETIVVINRDGDRSLRNISLPRQLIRVINPNPGAGRFYSIQLGLSALRPGHPVFLQNIDNPFTSPALLQKMVEKIREADYVAPVFQNKGGHPLLISQELARMIMKEPEGDRNLSVFLRNFMKATIETRDPGVLANINTEDDYRRHFETPINR